MSLVDRDVITIEDLSNQEIETIFSLADEMSESLKAQSHLCAGQIMATLFYEPSTRTRLSFESAMQRLGGRVISFADMRASSVAKGETIADTARTVSAYADIMVIRHPWEGAAKVAADYAEVPVINAGDGGHEHPTQTLCDLYTLKKEKGSIRGISVVLWGDLRYGRTVHSLAYGLARFGARVLLCSIPGLEMPQQVVRKIQSEYDCELIILKAQDMQSLGEKVDVLYLTPLPHQLPLFPAAATEVSTGISTSRKLPKIDALYVTRVQKERFAETSDNGRASYPVVDTEFLKRPKFKDTLVMHPLPRVDELDYAVDKYPQSVYFKQAARGVPIRMALTALLLGAKEMLGTEKVIPFTHKAAFDTYKAIVDIECRNGSCVSNQEKRYISPKFRRLRGKPLTLRCEYCEHEVYPLYIASSKWHQGTRERKRYYSADSFMPERIKPENLIIFGSETSAQAKGFKPGKRANIKRER